MQGSFVAALAATHLAEQPDQPLLAGIAARVNARNVLEALTSGCRPVQHVAWLRLVDLPDDRRESLILQSLSDNRVGEAELTVAMLRGLTHDSIPLSVEAQSRVTALISAENSDIRVAAATVIALRQPDAAWPPLQRQEILDRDVLRALCYADDPALIAPLMLAFGFPSKTPPPTIGFPVTAVWLGDHFSEDPTVAGWLIRNCGYCDDEVGPEVLNLLSGGFSYVTTRMTNEPRVRKVAHRWLRRIRSFVWRLLPDELELQRDDDQAFNVNNPLEIDLFIAAVRDSDRFGFTQRLALPPFSHEAMKRQMTPVCFHAASRYVRRIFVEQPLEWSDRYSILPERKGEFLIEHARVLLEPNDDLRIAADRQLRGKWISLSQAKRVQPARVHQQNVGSSTTNTPTSDGADTVIVNQRLSPGGNSIVNLAAACGMDKSTIATWLVDAEARWSDWLVPIGIEVQIPQVDPDDFAAWKTALPRLGVPSPIRPEFGGMLEAAFRPARSFHAMVLGPLLLCRLGVIAAPQDLALHISLQGEFDDRLRYLAFPQLLIHPSTRLRNRPDRLMTRVMSKGFIHVHNDAEALTPGSTSTCRTELRLFRIMAESDSSTSDRSSRSAETAANVTDSPDSTSMRLLPGFISDVIGTQILASASVSKCAGCRFFFEDYASAVQHAVNDLSVEFQQFLTANFRESTGEPRDESLLMCLPIFRCWMKVRDTVRQHNLSTALDIRFRQIRSRHVKQLLAHLADVHRIVSTEVIVKEDEIELTLPIAEGRVST